MTSSTVPFLTSTHGELWLQLSSSPGLAEIRLATLYSDILAGISAGGASPNDLLTFESISRDVGRTFSSTAPQGSIERLRRVLTAIAVYDRSIGYVQGLNFLAAFALLHVEREDQAFTLVIRLLNGPKYGMAVLYRERLRGVRAMARVLDELIERGAPGAHKALSRAGASALLFFEWHFSLFTLVLPADLTAQVWDVVFRDGFAPAAHRAVVVLARGLEPYFALANGSHETMALLKAYARARASAGDGLGGESATTTAASTTTAMATSEVLEGGVTSIFSTATATATATATTTTNSSNNAGPSIAAPFDLVTRMSAETDITLELVSRLSAEAEAFVDNEDNVKQQQRRPVVEQRAQGGVPVAAADNTDLITDVAFTIATGAGLALLGFGAALALRAARKK